MGRALKLGASIGFLGGFMFAYQRSSSTCWRFTLSFPHLSLVRFWGWNENSREYEKDLKELTQRTREGKSLYGESSEPQFVQLAAHRNAQWSQMKFCES